MDSHYLSLLEGAGGVMAAIALLVFHSNYMVAPLIPAFLREFAVLPDALDWLVAFSLHNSAKEWKPDPSTSISRRFVSSEMNKYAQSTPVFRTSKW
jgi:hypothetical protein